MVGAWASTRTTRISLHNDLKNRRRRRVPAGEFFSDAGARVAWAAVEGLDEGQKHAPLELLADELAVPEVRSGKQARRQARAVSALREAFRIHEERGGEALPQEDYRALRAEVGEQPCSCPSS